MNLSSVYSSGSLLLTWGWTWVQYTALGSLLLSWGWTWVQYTALGSLPTTSPGYITPELSIQLWVLYQLLLLDILLLSSVYSSGFSTNYFSWRYCSWVQHTALGSLPTTSPGDMLLSSVYSSGFSTNYFYLDILLLSLVYSSGFSTNYFSWIYFSWAQYTALGSLPSTSPGYIAPELSIQLLVLYQLLLPGDITPEFSIQLWVLYELLLLEILLLSSVYSSGFSTNYFYLEILLLSSVYSSGFSTNYFFLEILLLSSVYSSVSYLLTSPSWREFLSPVCSPGFFSHYTYTWRESFWVLYITLDSLLTPQLLPTFHQSSKIVFKRSLFVS